MAGIARPRLANDSGGALSSGNTRGSTAPIPFEGKINSMSAPYYGGSVPSPAASQAKPIPGGYAPAPSGVGVDVSRPNIPQASAPSYAPEAPYTPPPPRAGGREAYNQMDAGGQAATDSSWLAGDSDYTAQVAEYDKALQSFVDRIANQRKMFTEDANLATASTGRNQEMSLNNLGEDFGARGLSYSGMFDTQKNETNTRFNEAKSGIERIRSKNDTDAVNRETDYKAENAISKSNASRASLGRQAQRQALIDSGGF